MIEVILGSFVVNAKLNVRAPPPGYLPPETKLSYEHERRGFCIVFVLFTHTWDHVPIVRSSRIAYSSG